MCLECVEWGREDVLYKMFLEGDFGSNRWLKVVVFVYGRMINIWVVVLVLIDGYCELD